MSSRQPFSCSPSSVKSNASKHLLTRNAVVSDSGSKRKLERRTIRATS
uniref:Uncharacterized protein n=1 Tax=Rhizophora mucronata TaxID=61149 RepID=A0A2P2PR65_RHIMU